MTNHYIVIASGASVSSVFVLTNSNGNQVVGVQAPSLGQPAAVSLEVSAGAFGPYVPLANSTLFTTASGNGAAAMSVLPFQFGRFVLNHAVTDTTTMYMREY